MLKTLKGWFCEYQQEVRRKDTATTLFLIKEERDEVIRRIVDLQLIRAELDAEIKLIEKEARRNSYGRNQVSL